MPVDAVDVVRDPLLTPLLALLMAAINADVGSIMLHDGGKEVPAVVTTQLHPLSLMHEPDGGPRLSAYRISSRPVRTTMQRIDHVATVQFDYITPACGHEQLDARWPLLEQVWQVMVDALDKGHHAAYQDDEPALTNVLKVDLTTARKVELYADGQESTFPAFRAQMDITWRGEETAATRTYYPALSFTIALPRADGEDADGNPLLEDNADVTTVIAYTPLGVEERDAEPFEDASELEEETV